MSEATRLIDAMGGGDPHAAAELLPLVYQELRRLARAQVAAERPGQTLQATALVHEAYLRLIGDQPVQWNGRPHFFAAAAEAMRRILIEHARSRQSLKRGGDRERVPLHEELPEIAAPCDQVEDLLTLNEALDGLAVEHPAIAQLIKLCFFAGLSLEQAAVALDISRATAYRQWSFARAWLHTAMRDDDHA